MLPPQHLDDLERLAWYQAARASEEERKDRKTDERGDAFERFEDFSRKIAAVPKEKADREREKWERERDERKRAG